MNIRDKFPYHLITQTWERDHQLALAVGLLAIGASPIALVVSHIFAQTLPLTAAVGSFTYLLLSRSRVDSTQNHAVKSPTSSEKGLDRIRNLLPREITLLAPSVIFLCCTLAIISAISAGHRSLTFYFILIVTSSIFLLQLIAVRDQDLWPSLLLGQLLVIVATLRLPALALTPSYIGIDILTHIPNYAETILETGSLMAGLEGSKYLAAPLYHLLVVATALLGGVSVRNGLYLSLGLAILITPYFIYAITRRFGVPPRWAIFATALFGLTDYLTYWSLHLIPSSLGVVFLLSLLLLFAYQFTGEDSKWSLIVFPVLLLLVSLALTDQVSTFIMLVFLCAALLAQYALRAYDRITTISSDTRIDMTAYTAFFFGFVLLIWSITPFYGGTFTTSVIALVTDSLGDAPLLSLGFGSEEAAGNGGNEEGAVTGEGWGFVFTYLSRGSFLGLTFGAALGAFACLRPGAGSQARWTLLSSATLISFVALAPPLVGIGTLLPGRWFTFLYGLFAILLAIGLAVLSADRFSGLPPISIAPPSELSAIILSILLVLAAIAFPLTAIASTIATPEAPILTEEQPREALTAPEQSAADTLREITDSSESVPIYSDAYFAIALSRPGDQEYYTATIPDADSDAVENTSQTDVIYRTYQSDGAPEFSADDGESYISQINESQMCQETDSVLYDNPEVRYCSVD